MKGSQTNCALGDLVLDAPPSRRVSGADRDDLSLLGLSLRDSDPNVVLTSRRENGNVVAGARWGMKGRRQRSRCSRCLALSFVRTVALRLRSIGGFLRPEGTTVTEPRAAALRRAPWECGANMRHRSSRRRRVQPACSETEMRGVPHRGVLHRGGA